MLVAVRSMMGAGGPQAPMTLDQKKKLLWGKKPDPEEPEPNTAFGANRWDTAEFSNSGDKNKFIKLMVVPFCAFYPAGIWAAGMHSCVSDRVFASAHMGSA